jgi:hypothetical protein
LATELVVSGTTYEYPTNREAPGWGEEATAWAVAVTAVLQNITGTGDILQTSASISDSQTTFANISGFNFDPNTVRGAIIEYSIYRSSSAGEAAEAGQMMIVYKDDAATWDIAQYYAGNSGVEFQITSAGQVQYKVPAANALGGSGYAGTMKYRARALTI